MPKNKKQKVKEEEEEVEESSSSSDSSDSSSEEDVKIKKKENKSKKESDSEEESDSSDDSEESDDSDSSENEEEEKPKKKEEKANETKEKKKNGEEEHTGTIDEHTVFVGQLPRDATSSKIRAFFHSCGEINRVIIMKFKDTKKPMGSAFVEFKSEEAAQTACKMNGKKFEGKTLNVNLSKNKPSSNTPARAITSRTVYVGNLNFQTGEPKLKHKFQKCGKIIDINLPRFHDSNKRRGFAMIQFQDEKGVIEALKLNGKVIDRREVVVQIVANNKGTKEPKEVPKFARDREMQKKNERQSEEKVGDKRKKF